MRRTGTDSSKSIHSNFRANVTAASSTTVKRHRPVAYSTFAAEEILRLVLQHYELEHDAECTFFCRGVSDTYLLTTPSRRFALKVYPSLWRTREAIQGELSALTYLAAKGIEVAVPIARKDGSSIMNVRAPEGLRSAVLFDWAEGDAPKYTDATHALHYGRLVARLHDASDDLPPSASRPAMDMELLFRKPVERIRPRLALMPALAARFELFVHRLEARLTDAEKTVPDWGFCHGDVWANNARIHDTRVVLFDFDFCGLGWRAFDLATYRWNARLEHIEQLAWEPFLKGYLQIRPSAAQSLQFVPLFMVLRHLWFTAHAIGLSAAAGAGFISKEFFDDAITFFETIEREEALTFSQ